MSVYYGAKKNNIKRKSVSRALRDFCLNAQGRLEKKNTLNLQDNSEQFYFEKDITFLVEIQLVSLSRWEVWSHHS